MAIDAEIVDQHFLTIRGERNDAAASSREDPPLPEGSAGSRRSGEMPVILKDSRQSFLVVSAGSSSSV